MVAYNTQFAYPHHMKFTHLALVFLLFLVGCAKEAPKCSDEKTLDLVMQILSNELPGSGNSTDLAKKEIPTN